MKNSSRPFVSKVPATYAARTLLAATGKSKTCGECAAGGCGTGGTGGGISRTMSATGAAVPPAFQRVKPRTVPGARSAMVGAPSPWARRTVNTCVGVAAAAASVGAGVSGSSS